MDLKEYANMFKAICACELLEMVNCNPFTLSHNMKISTNGGLVISRIEWKWVHYLIDKEKVEWLNNYLK